MNKYERPMFEDMSFSDIEGDPEYAPFLQEAALEYLRTENREYFEREYSGELDSEGYLFKKDGTSSNTKPSQNIGGGKPSQQVLELTKEKIRNRTAS